MSLGTYNLAGKSIDQEQTKDGSYANGIAAYVVDISFTNPQKLMEDL